MQNNCNFRDRFKDLYINRTFIRLFRQLIDKSTIGARELPIYAAAGGELIIAEIEDITASRSTLNSVQLTKIREASLLNVPRLVAWFTMLHRQHYSLL